MVRRSIDSLVMFAKQQNLTGESHIGVLSIPPVTPICHGIRRRTISAGSQPARKCVYTIGEVTTCFLPKKLQEHLHHDITIQGRHGVLEIMTKTFLTCQFPFDLRFHHVKPHLDRRRYATDRLAQESGFPSDEGLNRLRRLTVPSSFLSEVAGIMGQVQRQRARIQWCCGESG